MFAVLLSRSRHEPGKDVNRDIREKLSQGFALPKRRDEEGLAAGAGKDRCSLCHAEAVGVGFYDGSAFGPRGKLAQMPVIGDKRVKIDGKDCGLARISLRGQSRRSGRRSSLARLLNLVNSRVNCSLTVPVGPWRCLPMITSALP